MGTGGGGGGRAGPAAEGRSAAQAYRENYQSAQANAGAIDTFLDAHHGAQLREPNNWGYHGDMAYVAEQLHNTRDFLAGTETVRADTLRPSAAASYTAALSQARGNLDAISGLVARDIGANRETSRWDVVGSMAEVAGQLGETRDFLQEGLGG